MLVTMLPRRAAWSVLPSCVVLLACGDGGGGSGSDTATTAIASTGGSESTTQTSTTATVTSADSGGPSSSGGDTFGTKFDMGVPPDMPAGDCFDCAPDFQSIVTCDGAVVEACGAMQGCDLMSHSCIDACTAAANNRQSVGCEYYATFMQHWDGPGNRCFVAFVANTWNSAVHLQVEYDGAMLPVESFTRIPSGAGPGLVYGAYDDAAGLAPGEVAILFLSGPQGPGPACPIASAVPAGVAVSGTGLGESFRIVADVPVVAYQMNPYGGGSAAVTGASLLLPTSAWDTNYVVINPLPTSNGDPTANIIAAHDGTTVTLQPSVALAGGGGVPGGPADVAVDIMLDQAQHVQLTQEGELTGSIIQADAPVGLMGGHTGMLAPVGTFYSDHAEQMIPPVRSLGSEYVGVMHRPRVDEPSLWRVIGVVDGTVLSWSSDVGGPAMLDRGDRTEFITDEPFVVTSQDVDHPFVLLDLMSGSQWQPSLASGYGDSDFVISVPPDQWMRRYVFFTDPTYPETNLVVIRRPSQGQFADVELDCAGTLGGWQPIGNYEWTRVDLVTGDFEPVGACDNGRHEMNSDGRFGLWVWGWGTPLTSTFTSNVSYGYPGGMNVQPINDVVLEPEG